MSDSVPGYVQRYTRILRALDVLAYYPDGLPLRQLADELGATTKDLRDEILAYYTAEPAAPGAYRLPGLAWVSPSGEEDDPATAEVVMLTDRAALAELGVVRMSTNEMAAIWRAGRILAEYEPDNEVLAQALDVLARDWLHGPSASVDPGSEHVSRIRDAIDARQRLEITYQREWRPGGSTRVVEPYRLLHTNGGWELDAGGLDDAGEPRTFLLANMSDVTALPERFELPEGIGAILDRHRAQLRVEVSLPQRTAWAAATLADRMSPIREDSETVTVAVDLSPPYARRLALILAPTMGAGMLMDHLELAEPIRESGARLLLHHGFDLP